MGEKYRRKPDILRILPASAMRADFHNEVDLPWEQDYEHVKQPCSQAFPGRLINEWLVMIDTMADIEAIMEETGKEVSLVMFDGELTIKLG